MNTLPRAAVILMLAFTLTACVSLGAQTLPIGPAAQRALRDTALAHDIPGRWVMKAPAVHAKITSTQRAAMLAQLGSIASLLRSSVGALPGVEADASEGVEPTDLPGGGSVVGGDLKLLLWPYSVRDGRLQFYENGAELVIHINGVACAGRDAIGGGYGFLVASRMNGHFHGFPMLDSVVVITHRAAPPCIPVTRGEVVQAISQRMARDHANSDSAARAGAANQERALRQAAKSNPALAAQLRQEMATMQRMADSLRAAGQSQMGGVLARMSPAERASPAYLSDSCHASELEACFMDAGAPAARAVVRANPAFFDMSRPTDVQVITIDLRRIERGRGTARYATGVLDAALAKLDWGALNAVVR